MQRGQRVVAIDTDSNPNLAMSLGLDEQTAAEAPLVPRQLVVPYEPAVVDADRAGSRLQASGPVAAAVERVLAFVDSEEEQRAALLADKARIDQRLAALREH